MSSHRWALITISRLDADMAAEVAGRDLPERTDDVAALLAAGDIETVRGPVCTECRVHWRDVHRSAEPWPCPGRRPDDLGGPLQVGPDQHMSRAERRRRQRQAEAEAPKAEKRLMAAVNAAVMRATEPKRPIVESSVDLP